MAQLMGKGEHVVQLVGEVEQHIGVYAVNAAGECAGGLSLVLVYVYPALAEGPVKKPAVFLAQRSEGLLYYVLCFLEGELHARVLYHRIVEVVHMQLFKAQRLLAEGDIPAHGGQRLMHRLNKAVIHRHRHVVAVELGGKGALVAPYVSEVIVELHAAAVHGRKGVYVSLEFPEVFFKGFPAHPAVGALAVHAEAAVGELHFLAIFVPYGGKGHIHALQHGKAVVRGLSRIRQHGEHLFLFRGEHMLAHADYIRYLVAVQLQLRGMKVGLQGLCGERSKLGGYVACGRVQLHQQHHGPLVHGLVLRVAVVTRLVEFRIKIHEHGLVNQVVKAVQRRLCPSRGTHGAGVPAHLRNPGLQLHKCLLPVLVGLVYLCKIPHIPFVHILTCLELSRHIFVSFAL